jgi:hypothetical protein
MIETIFIYYLWFCLGIATAWMACSIYSDIVKGPDHKFGYACTSGFNYLIMFLVACPLVNIVVVSWWVLMTAIRKFEGA